MAEPSFPPYNVGDLGAGVRRQAPAAARNVMPIGDVLAEWLPSRGLVLEIASGTGARRLYGPPGNDRRSRVADER